MARYLSIVGWTHIFTEKDEAGRSVERERTTDWVYDTQDEKLVHLDVHGGFGSSPGTPAEMDDVEESVKDNLALSSAVDLDIEETDELPEWASGTSGPKV